MNERVAEAILDSSWSEEFARTLGGYRERARGMVRSQRERFEQIEEKLAEQIDHIARHLAEVDVATSSGREQVSQEADELRSRAEQLDTQDARLAELQRKLDERAAELDKVSNQLAEDNGQRRGELRQRQQHVEARVGELDDREAQLNQRVTRLEQEESNLRQSTLEQEQERDRLGTERSELETETSRLAEDLSQLAEERKKLDHRRQQLADDESRLAKDRNALAAQRNEESTAELVAAQQELDRKVAELQRLEQELGKVRTELASQMSAGQVTGAQAQSDQEELREHLSQYRKQLSDQQEEAGRLRTELAAAAAATADSGAQQDELARLQRTIDELTSQLEDSRQQISEGSTDQEVDDLRRRLELAVEDLRDQKNDNEQLRQQLAAAQTGPADADSSAPLTTGLDWESQKRQLLASLDDYDASDLHQVSEKRTAQNAIDVTNRVVAEKDQELEQLRSQLEALDETAAAGSDVAVGATAIADLLDQDELVKQERENLKTVQQEWRDKLRKAETDISVERAKIARERSGLEEKLREIASRRDELPGDDAPKKGKGAKPPGNRWLAKLGLDSNDDASFGPRRRAE